MKSYKLSADQKTQTSEIQTKPLIKNLEPFKEKLKVDWSLDSNRIFQTKFNQLVSSFIAEAKKINIYPIDSTHLNSYEEYKNFFQNFIQVFNKDLNKYTEAFESFDSETKTKEVGIRFNSSSYESLYKNLSQTIQYINAECSKKKTPLVSNSPVQPVVRMNQAVIPQGSPVDDLADSTGDWTVISDEEDFNPHVAFKKGQTLFQTS